MEVFRTLRKAGVLAFPKGDELAIESYFGDSLMAFCCIAAVFYKFPHITSWLNKLRAKIRLCQCTCAMP